MTFRIAVLMALLATSIAIPVRGQDQSPTPGTSAEAAPQKPMRVRISGNIMQKQIIQNAAPVYPPIARAAQVQGTVVFHAIIATDGSVEQLELVSGPPLLVRAALDAVKQWRYQPTTLNGQAVEVDTTVEVVFTLDGTPPQDSQPIDPQLKADILHLFDAMHLKARETEAAHAMFGIMRPSILASLPPTPNREKIADAYGEKFLAVITSEESMDRYAALYAKHLSDDDVKALTAFYETPAGQHYNDAAGQIESEGAQIGAQLARENLANIYKGLCADFPELKGAASFCPKDEQQNHGALIAPDRFGGSADQSGD
jgi:TonB family protein